MPVIEPRSRYSYSVVKVETDDGVTGWGECRQASGEELAAARTRAVGQEATAYDVVTHRIGTANPVTAGVNMALIDIGGKAAKVPAYQLLGGPTRNKVRAVTPAGAQALLEQAMLAGHRAFTIPVRLPSQITSRPRIVGSIVKMFEDLRKTIGEDRDFVADAGGTLPSAEATDLAVALEPLHPLWFDQPVRAASHDVLGRITSESAVPIGLGRDFDTISPIQNLLRDGLVDIVRLDIAKLGITPIRRAAAVAETYYIAVAPYLSGTGPIATAASMHLAASLPNFFAQDVPLVADAETRKLRDDMVGGAIEKVTNGYLSLSTKPGLGIEVNEALIRRMAA